MNELICKQIVEPALVEAAQQLRIDVFVTEQGIPEDLEIDGKDPISFHVGVFDGDSLVGTGRLTPANETLGVLSRITVVSSHRKQGIGQIIMKELERIAQNKSFEHLQLTPHHYLEKFYSELGYSVISRDEGSVGGHPLIKMEKWLTRL